MLTGLKLGNFKAFGDTQNIPIKPLTLIYGANSAGKSSIIHGLLLGCHANQTGNFDAHQTRLGGDSVDLGGFQCYVHRRDTTQTLRWGMQISPQKMSQLEPEFRYFKNIRVDCFVSTNNQNDEHTAHVLAMQKYEIFIDNESLMVFCREEIESESGGTEIVFVLDEINILHAIFGMMLDSVISFHHDDIEAEYIKEKLRSREAEVEIMSAAIDLIHAKFSLQSEVMPVRPTNDWAYKTSKIKADYDDLILNLMEGTQNALDGETLCQLAMFPIIKAIEKIVRPIEYTANIIFERTHYLGPMRTYPPRRIIFPDKQLWYDDAWNAVREEEGIRNAVNAWLGADWLKTRYEFDIVRYVAQGVNKATVEELVLRDKRYDTVVSHRDVGFGISQVLPVLVYVYGWNNDIIAIEQPEIHLHPALQAELGDLFIQSALGENRNTFLLETHSEHLLLRIMRRMRETANGTLPEGVPPVRPEDVAVLFVQPKQDNSTSVVTELRLDEDGEFIDRWPGGFFEEGARELFG